METVERFEREGGPGNGPRPVFQPKDKDREWYRAIWSGGVCG